MKTSEFREKLKDYSLYVGETEGYFILSYYSAFIAEVSKTRQGSLSIYSMPFKQLVYTLIEYAETPIEEREEEKKYYVVLPDEERESYLNIVPVLKRFEGKIIIVLEEMRKILVKRWFHLTEAEIKRNHEYLWQFAKEVQDET